MERGSSAARTLKVVPQWGLDTTAQDRRQRICSQRIRALYGDSAIANLGHCLIGAIAVICAWPSAHRGWLLCWALALLIPELMRLFLHRAYRVQATDIQDSTHDRWLQRFCLCSAMTGALWGAYFLLVPVGVGLSAGVLLGLHVTWLAFVVVNQAVCVRSVHCFAWSAVAVAMAAILYTASPASPLFLAIGLLASTTVALICAHRIQQHVESTLGNCHDANENLIRLATERDQLHAQLQARNRFVIAAGHDLRQPLHAIKLYATSLAMQSECRDASVTVGKIQESISSLNGLTDALMDICRLDTGQWRCSPRQVVLSDVVDRVRGNLEVLADESKLRLLSDVDPELQVHVDPALLERVLMNLVGNAIKYTDAGLVRIRAVSDDLQIRLIVSDTGRGIASDQQALVFSEYHQLDNPERNRQNGFGLGLAIVQRLCALMDIPIDLDSLPGVGSTFTLTLERSQRALLSRPDQAPRTSCRDHRS